MFNSIKNEYLKSILMALSVVIAGFILLNLVFLVYALVINGISLLLPANFAEKNRWYMEVVVLVVSMGFLVGYWYILKSQIADIYKATLTVVPTAIVLAIIGISFYPWPYLVVLTGALAVAAILYYFYTAKRPWIYWFAVIAVALSMLIMLLTGAEI